MTGQIYQEVVANVAEHHDIPLAALHFYPMRANGEIAFPARLPGPMVRSTITTLDWLYWRMTKGVEDEQRRVLGLPRHRAPRRSGWPTAVRWKFRPTTSSAFRGWRPNGHRNSAIGDRLSVR